MSNGDLNWITNFIWGIADDALRDLYVRGKYRDVILPMMVLRRLDAVLEPGKQAVLSMKENLDKAGITNQDAALRQAAGQAFYNTSRFTLRDLRASQAQLKADFEAYLDGFSPNVQEILDNFEFRNQIPKLSKADVLGTLIEKFLGSTINLGPKPVLNGDGSVKHYGLDNHAMGTVFEELVRRFNEANNEEAGEHWTPRDAVKLMAKLIFVPIADQLTSGTYLLYDGACGTGGMLTVGEETLTELATKHGKQVSTHLFGQEINAETYAIAKADLLLKGEGEEADNIVGGPEWSTLANDAFPSREFDFMLSNPPYGKSWKSDQERMGGKEAMRDPRFVIEHAGDAEYSLVTRSSDGQMLFLANMLSKMKHNTPLGSRIAEVHNGSSLFTGDAGGGESNVRRWVIENDWLEAIVALPLNMFYNTGIATYVWVLTNRKPGHRSGKVQLIDATAWFKPLRKSLGKKNCELADADIERIIETFLTFDASEQSRIFDNAEFGYWKVTVERPLRLAVTLSEPNREQFRQTCLEVDETPIANVVDRVQLNIGQGPHKNYNTFIEEVQVDAERHGVKITAKRAKLMQSALATRDERAERVIRRIHKPGKLEADPLGGLFPLKVRGKLSVVEYEPDSDLRDTETVPLQEPGGIEAFIRREVLPHAPDAWIDPGKTTIGYEISFTRYFYKPQPLRSLDANQGRHSGTGARNRWPDGRYYWGKKMIGGLRPYSDMTPTELPWLPELPRKWEIHRAKYSFFESDDRSARGYEELLSVSHKTGVTPRSQKNITMFMAESYEGHKVCHPGDIVVNTMWAWMAALGVSKHIGIVSPAYGIYRARAKSQFEPKYLDYLLRTETYRAEYIRSSRGVTTSRLRLYPPDFLNIPFVQPPLDEQRLIVRFLDWHGAQTAKLIRAKQGLLKLVADEREALTHDVVSSSGTQQIRLEVATEQISRLVSRESSEIYTPVGLYNRGRGIFRKTPSRGNELGDSTFFWIKEGDLVLSGQFAWEGAVALAGAEEDGCIASHRYHILRGTNDLLQTIYLSSFLRTSFGHFLLDEHSRGAAGRNRPLNIRTLLKEKIPVPPQNEQTRLVELVTLEKRLSGSIARFSKHLREFRTRLIADVVTGKLDVRAAAASLPETIELDAIDEPIDDENLDEGTDAQEDEELAA